MKKAIHLRVAAPVKSRRQIRPSERARAVAAMFGIAAASLTGEIFPPFILKLRPGDLVLITGPSGSGKSTLLAGIAKALRARRLLDFMMLGAPHENMNPQNSRALVDCFAAPLEEAMRLLAMAGLSEARLLLRSPADLSEGEQFRFRLATFLASEADLLIADEFAAVLDRVTARAAAWQLGKFIRASWQSARPRAAILATNQTDLESDLHPTLTIRTHFAKPMEIITH